MNKMENPFKHVRIHWSEDMAVFKYNIAHTNPKYTIYLIHTVSVGQEPMSPFLFLTKAENLVFIGERIFYLPPEVKPFFTLKNTDCENNLPVELLPEVVMWAAASY